MLADLRHNSHLDDLDEHNANRECGEMTQNNELDKIVLRLEETSVTSFCGYVDHLVARNQAEKSPTSSLQWQPFITLLQHLSHCVRDREGDFDLIIKRLDDVSKLATQKFYAYPFKDVPLGWRDTFRAANFLKFALIASKGRWGVQDESARVRHEPTLDELVSTLDMALIMVGKPQHNERVELEIDEIVDLLQQIHQQTATEVDVKEPQVKRRKLGTAWTNSFPDSTAFAPSVKHQIQEHHEMDFLEFERYMNHPLEMEVGPVPIILADCLEYWPARHERPWNSPSYLLSQTIGGRRLVPIELGRSYVDEGWGQRIVPFKTFLDDYIVKPTTSSAVGTGYLAQYDLFSQIPALRNDITIPDLCYTSPPPPHQSSPLAGKHAALPKLEEPLLNAWLGPAGTISPLHTDPYHNILAQVVGRKYVRLYAPRESRNLYARGMEEGGIDMGNTSTVDVGLLEGWDGSAEEREQALTQFPLFSSAKYVDCVLEEGQCLYLPLGWWHYVRSLSVSFSVSFWFN